MAKVKVLGKGEAGLKKLAEYISRENIPDFLGGESPAIVGPADPLWAEVDAAMGAWANGGDPFLDRRAMRKVSARIERQRASAAVAANTARKRRAKVKAVAREEMARDIVLEETPDGSLEVEEEVEVVEEEGGGEEELVQETPAKVGVKACGEKKKARRKAGQSSGRGKHRAVKTHGRHRRSQRTDHVRVGTAKTESRPRKEANKVSSRKEGLDVKSRRRGKQTASRGREREGQGDRGVEDVGGRGKEVCESALEGMVKKVFPVAVAVFTKVFGAVMTAAKVFLSVVEGVFLFLRDTLFEQVEVDE